MNKTVLRISIVSLIAMICSPLALGGGLYLNEFGTPVMGNAGAGSAAEASDASTAFHNPAGMMLLDKKQFMITGGLMYSEIRFDANKNLVGGGDGGNAGGWAPLMGAFYAHPLNEEWAFGFSASSLSAAALSFDSGWVGRYQCKDVTIFTLTAMPTLAYRVNDWLSVAAGPMFTYGALELDLAAPLPMRDGEISLDGDDMAYGYSLSTMMELSERTRVGITYLSEQELDFEGDLKAKGGPLGGFSFGSTTELKLPHRVRGSVYHRLDDKWALVGSLGWEDWSAMDNVLLTTERGSAALKRNWRDTWHYAGGFHYRTSDKWLWRAGVAYDTSPVGASDRTADMPIDQQLRYAVGADYEMSENFTVGASFEYANYGKAPIDAPGFNGDFRKNDLYFLGLNANWTF